MKKKLIILNLLFTLCTTQSQTWDYLGNAGFSGLDANYLSLAIDSQSQEVYVAYQDLTYSGKLSLNKYQGNDIWGQSADAPIPLISGYSTGYANFIDLNIDDNGLPYLSFIDSGVGDALKIVGQYSNGNYYTAGTAPNGNFYGGYGINTKIKKDVDNELYIVSYADEIHFYGTSGLIEITPNINITALSFDFKYGSGYVAYSNLDDGGKIDIQKVSSSESIETYDNISDGLSNYIDLEINPLTIQPYIAFQDLANEGKVTVKKLNGDNWELVGEEAFSGGLSNYVDLAFDSNGVPYVAYQDVSFSNKLSVMTYDGTGWEYVGERGVSSASASYCSIELNSDGEIFVAFKDGSQDNKASVLSYGSTLSLNDITDENIILYPNPTNDKIYFEGIENYYLEIYNNLGQKILDYEKVNSIDISSLSKGVYFIKFSDGINSSTKKFIKN